MTARRKRKRAPGAGRKPLPPGKSRDVVRTVKLRPDEAAAHDAARGEQPWSDWVREAAAQRIAREADPMAPLNAILEPLAAFGEMLTKSDSNT